MSLPFTEQQCFFVAMLVFIVVGFQRGWRRELVTLVFVLLAVFLIHPDSSVGVGRFIERLPSVFSYLTTGSSVNAPAPAATQTSSFFGGVFGSLLLFAAVIALGYYVGNRAFPAKPATPQERFIGIVPAVVSGAFVLGYLSSYFPKNAAGQSYFSVNVQPPDPSNYVPVIFVIAVIAIVVALIAARAKKTPVKK